jgi:hypothetical protein
MIDRKVYREIAQCIESKNYIGSHSIDWMDYLDDIVKNYLPSGSGIDSGNSIDMVKSNSSRIVINSAYHSMDNDSYCGWNEFTIVVTSSLLSTFSISINFHGIKPKSYGLKDYLLDLYNYSLTRTMQDSDNIGAYL